MVLILLGILFSVSFSDSMSSLDVLMWLLGGIILGILFEVLCICGDFGLYVIVVVFVDCSLIVF